MSKPVRLIQISDTHCYADDNARLEWTEVPIYPNRSLQAVLTHLQPETSRFDALIISGDLAQEETAATYQRLSDVLAAFPLPVYALPGNHDIPALMRAHLQGNVHLPDQFVSGEWHILLLDTSSPGKPDGHLSETQFQQLEQLLETVPAGHFVAIFMHHHPVAIGSRWMDVMGLRQDIRFWELVEKFPCVRAVFNGHIHQEFSGAYTYASGRKVPVYGTPATCVQLKPLHATIHFDHTLPAWREIALHADGRVETRVFYLSLQACSEDVQFSI